MPKEIEKREHEKLIRILSDYLKANGYEVKIEGTTEYAGYRADIEATKGKEILCIEVVNGTNIDSPEVRKKWEAISGNRNCDFCLFVPEHLEKEVKKLLEKWAIYYKNIWIYTSDDE